MRAIAIGDAADLDEGASGDIRRVGGLGARRDERARRRHGVGRPHERLADEGAIEPEGAPALDRPGVADARFGDDEAIVRHERPQPIGSLGVDRRACAGRGC